MSTNCIVAKAARYDQKSFLAHFQKWAHKYVLNISDISHLIKVIVVVSIFEFIGLVKYFKTVYQQVLK